MSAAAMRIATFNVQNLRLRQHEGGPHLQGARDRDDDLPPDTARDVGDRRLTAGIMARIDADILCLQEVFDRATLDHFHDAFLMRTGTRPYPHRICEPGNDGHGMNVAVMSRRAPDRVQSHAQATAAGLGLDDAGDLLHGGPVFRRDCLEVAFGELTLFVCHLKAPHPEPERARAIRTLEAQAIRRIVERAFPDPAARVWMILGDLNTPLRGASGPDGALAPLLDGFAVDLMARLPEGEGWTYAMPGSRVRLCLDGMLASPALARCVPEAVPQVERRGMEDTAADTGAAAAARAHASDHAAVWIDLPDAVSAPV